MDWTAIHKQKNIRRCRPVHCRQTNKPRKPDIIAHRVKHDRFAGKSLSHNRANSRLQPALAWQTGG